MSHINKISLVVLMRCTNLLEFQEVCKFLLENAGSGTGTPESLYYVSSAWKSLASCGTLPVDNVVKVSVEWSVTVDRTQLYGITGSFY
jgi:hypothetical protein